MPATLLRTSTARAALRAGALSSSKHAGLAGLSFTRGKATLPDLPCKLSQPQWVSIHLTTSRKPNNPHPR